MNIKSRPKQKTKENKEQIPFDEAVKRLLRTPTTT